MMDMATVVWVRLSMRVGGVAETHAADRGTSAAAIRRSVGRASAPTRNVAWLSCGGARVTTNRAACAPRCSVYIDLP